MPFFSILIPSYNRPNFIEKTVTSILQNDFNDFEIVISDDKSPEQCKIYNKILPFLDDKRITLHLQDINMGEPGNRDFLFREAKGDWHIVLGDDDLLYPNALGYMYDAIKNISGPDIFGFGYTIINEYGKHQYSRKAPSPLTISTKYVHLVRELLMSDTFPFWLYHPATFCSNKSIVPQIKSKNTVGIGDDFMFMMDFINNGGTLYILPHVLMCYRKSNQFFSNNSANQSAGKIPHLIARSKILNDLLSRDDLQTSIYRIVHNPYFEKRFLFDPMIASELSDDNLKFNLGLSEAVFDRFIKYKYKITFLSLYTKWMFLRRCIVFLDLFGMRGLIEIIKVAIRRLYAYLLNNFIS